MASTGSMSQFVAQFVRWWCSPLVSSPKFGTPHDPHDPRPPPDRVWRAGSGNLSFCCKPNRGSALDGLAIGTRD